MMSMPSETPPQGREASVAFEFRTYTLRKAAPGCWDSVAFYSSGFPCTPYSWLHCDTQLLAEPDALPMWQSICNFKLAAPAEPCIEFTLTFHDHILILLMYQFWSLWWCMHHGKLRLGCSRMFEGSSVSWMRSCLSSEPTCPSDLIA